MRKNIFFILIFSQSILFSQNNYILNNIFSLNLSFKMNADSVKNINLITSNENSYDSLPLVNINGTPTNINSFLNEYTPLGSRHRTKIKTYSFDNKDSLIILLDFYSQKLIEVAIFLKDTVKIKQLKNILIDNFNLKKYTWKGENKTEKYFFIIKKTGYSYLVFSDKKVIDNMPSWCGNSRKRGSWKKIDKYLNSKK